MDIKVLVIDDVLDERQLIVRHLEDAGYEVMDAETGEAGVKMAEEQRPDVVITDTSMPGMDGFETCLRIKALDGLATKVIITTGQIDAVDANKARQAGADDYCVKTSDNQYLVEAVNKMTA